MTLQNSIPETEAKVEETSTQDVISVDASKIQNSVLQRLIEEVKVERQNNISAYNRLHNRHNRSR
jgi:phage-related protein